VFLFSDILFSEQYIDISWLQKRTGAVYFI